MNCETIKLMLNAALDGELSPAERRELDQHLSACISCRTQYTDLKEIDSSLKRALNPSGEPSLGELMSVIALQNAKFESQPPSITAHAHEHSTSLTQSPPSSRSTQHPWRSVATVASLIAIVVVMAVVIRLPIAAPAVAEVTLATGSIDVMRSHGGKWTAVNGPRGLMLTAHSRIRTHRDSLCEIRTKSDSLVRLNSGTEVVMHQPEQIELVCGEVWCRTPLTTAMEISTINRPHGERRETTFTCPASCETQWQASDDHELKCLAVSPSPIELAINPPQTSCTVNPGDTLTFAAGNAPTNSGHADKLEAIHWQLPLLILRNPNDPELNDRLIELLAAAGHSKMAFLYEEQIRQLGPRGTLPLVAFVRSTRSRNDPARRQCAMRIIADLAPLETAADLEALCTDNDPHVQELARRTLQRLNPNHDFETR